jgi:hypothetical protein
VCDVDELYNKSAPASTRLESYTNGGYGPLHSYIVNNNHNNGTTPTSTVLEGNHKNGMHHNNSRYDSDKKNKKYKSTWRYNNINSSSSLCCYCCYICNVPGYKFFEKKKHNKAPNTNDDDDVESSSSSTASYYYYLDDFNDLSFSCTMGTSDDNGIWLNRNGMGFDTVFVHNGIILGSDWWYIVLVIVPVQHISISSVGMSR